MRDPIIAVTPGEPAGIGPDLIVHIAQQSLPANLVVIADAELLQQRAKQLELPLHVRLTDETTGAFTALPRGQLWVHHVPLHAPSHCGQLNPMNATYVLETLRLAVSGCLQAKYAALVTGPVHKGIINAAGILFQGHTEFLAALTKTEYPVMMLATPRMRVALVTTHLPLAKVPSAITANHLERVLRVVQKDLQTRFALAKPRIGVCGLNPHAGEGGYLGKEEIVVITPVLDKLRQEGFLLQGPLPADTIFTPHHLANMDVIVAMYHDQGLPVLKANGFGEAVNITLGLPIIRTSVDHGTALTLAGSRKANAGSLLAAITAAHQLIAC